MNIYIVDVRSFSRIQKAINIELKAPKSGTLWQHNILLVYAVAWPQTTWYVVNNIIYLCKWVIDDLHRQPSAKSNNCPLTVDWFFYYISVTVLHIHSFFKPRLRNCFAAVLFKFVQEWKFLLNLWSSFHQKWLQYKIYRLTKNLRKKWLFTQAYLQCHLY